MTAVFVTVGGIPAGVGASTRASNTKNSTSPLGKLPISHVTVPPASLGVPRVGLVPSPDVGPRYVSPVGITSVTFTNVASAGP